MVFDLGAAMRRKEEFESARWTDFEFRRRARATRRLADEFGIDPGLWADLFARLPEDAVVARLAAEGGMPPERIAARYATIVEETHRRLVAERGDPTPHPLA